MKFFLGFLLLCFFGGVVLMKVKPVLRTLILLLICVFLIIGFYFLNKL